MLARSGSRRRGGRILKSNEGSFAASIRLLRKKRRQGCDVRLLGGESFPLSSEEGGARAFALMSNDSRCSPRRRFLSTIILRLGGAPLLHGRWLVIALLYRPKSTVLQLVGEPFYFWRLGGS